ncbi:MAG: glycosyltransferase [Actinomycetota bacterium]|nr:glycosyltransferase [Actinomycetota bacterium]
MNINIVTPWYPEPVLGRPYSGIFVQRQVEALRKSGSTVSVEVPSLNTVPVKQIPANLIAEFERQAMESPESLFVQRDDFVKIPAIVVERPTIKHRALAIERSLRVKRSVIRSNYDIEHVHVALPSARAVLNMTSNPVFITEHSSQAARDCSIPEVAEVYKESILKAEAFICVSEFLQKQISESLSIKIASNWKIVPNIVDVNTFKFAERDTPAGHAWIYVGALYESKGVEKLLKSFYHFNKNHSDSNLTLVGDGPLKSWIKRYLKAKNLRDSVRILKPTNSAKISEYLRNADLMVHLSPYETFGLVSLEAIASGLPVVSLKNGGAQETWGDFQGICGVQLENKLSPQEISVSIQDWLRYRPELDLHQASQIIDGKFSPSSISNQLLQMYTEAIL